MFTSKSERKSFFRDSINLGIEAGLGETLLVLNGNPILKDKHITERRLRLITSFKETIRFSPAVKGASSSRS